MMLSALKSFLIICTIVLSFSSVYAMTPSEFLYTHEDRIVRMCEDREQSMLTSRDNLLFKLFNLPGHYECGITMFFGLHKVIDLMLTIDRSSEDWKVFIDIMRRNEIPEYETFDFITIHLDYEAYMAKNN